MRFSITVCKLSKHQKLAIDKKTCLNGYTITRYYFKFISLAGEIFHADLLNALSQCEYKFALSTNRYVQEVTAQHVNLHRGSTSA